MTAHPVVGRIVQRGIEFAPVNVPVGWNPAPSPEPGSGEGGALNVRTVN